MKFYSDPVPTVNEITMCTIVACNPETGFDVHLDEYNLNGFLILKELSTKNIRKSISSFLRVGTQLPLSVIEVDNLNIVMSKKDVKGNSEKLCRERFQLNEKLFSLAKRLSHITDHVEETWANVFRSVLDPDILLDDHPYTLLSSRSSSGDDLLPLEYMRLITENNSKLFGITPIIMRRDFTVQTLRVDGMEYVKSVLIRIRDHYMVEGRNWTNIELHNDPNAVNVIILPLAIPVFQLQIIAYHQERCDAVFTEIATMLKAESFDFLDLSSKL